MSLSICVAGASGNVGRELVRSILESDDLDVVSAVGKSSIGKNLRDIVHDNRLNLVVSGSITEALSCRPDVLIDYTRADATRAHVNAAIDLGINVVIGTSGLTDDDYAKIQRRALEASVGVIAAGNFSITAALLQKFATIAAEYMPHWEIIDYASDTKPDAPSATARELAAQLASVQEPQWTIPVDGPENMPGSRGVTLNHSQIHSVRVPGFCYSGEIVFGVAGERLTIRRDAINTQPYISGTLLAARRVCGLTGLQRGLADLLESSS